MQIKLRQYPHPVLSYFADDLINCAFQSTIKTSITQTTYKFDVICKTSSQGLLDLIKKNQAHYAIHIECPSTRFRKLFPSLNGSFSFEIPADLLDGKVQICAFITASENILNYKNTDFNQDYGEISFRINKGDVLAVDRDRLFYAEKQIDPLKKIPSIFTVIQNNNPNPPPFDIELTGNKVAILLSPENFRGYKFTSMVQDLQSTLATMLILPALAALVETMRVESAKNQEMEFEDRRWFRALGKKLKNIGIDIHDPNSFIDSSIVIAQKLIGDPLAASLKTLEAYHEE